MTLTTGFTELFGIRHPIALAPMGGSAGGALAAAVSNGGGLGLLGSGDGERRWLDRELAILTARTGQPWGVGFLTWAVDLTAVDHVLERGARAVMFSFGDPGQLVEPVRRAGAALILQVTDLEEARRAVDLGADVVVAQGTEAGGHGARRGRSTMSFVPLVADLAAPAPVLAAGGIGDGRGVAAALALGAGGALLGSRFQATAESLADPAITAAIVAGRGEQTERNRILDVARGSRWPAEYTARTLAHPHLDRWRGREEELAASAEARADYDADVARGAIPPVPVWAGEAIDLITDLPPAADLVGELAAQAEAALARAGRTDPS
jgi:nitronate monooxygenase